MVPAKKMTRVSKSRFDGSTDHPFLIHTKYCTTITGLIYDKGTISKSQITTVREKLHTAEEIAPIQEQK